MLKREPIRTDMQFMMFIARVANTNISSLFSLVDSTVTVKKVLSPSSERKIKT